MVLLIPAVLDRPPGSVEYLQLVKVDITEAKIKDLYLQVHFHISLLDTVLLNNKHIFYHDRFSGSNSL